jgi:hypothetical protein
MYGGAAVGLLGSIVSALTTHNVSLYTYSSTSRNAATVHSASSLVAGVIVGIIIAGLWLWMAWKTGAGRNWARVLSTIFFGFSCLGLIGVIADLSGGRAISSVLPLVGWGIGLAALIHLWKRESSEFFTSAKQANAASAYGAAFPGYLPPGYGQPPEYGQPGYGQPPQYGQPGYGQAPQGGQPPDDPPTPPPPHGT